VPLTVAVVPVAVEVPIGVALLVPITDIVKAPETVPLLPVGVTDELPLFDRLCEDETLVLGLPLTVRLSIAD
jgi:hypothetical protein